VTTSGRDIVPYQQGLIVPDAPQFTWGTETAQIAASLYPKPRFSIEHLASESWSFYEATSTLKDAYHIARLGAPPVTVFGTGIPQSSVATGIRLYSLADIATDIQDLRRPAIVFGVTGSLAIGAAAAQVSAKPAGAPVSNTLIANFRSQVQNAEANRRDAFAVWRRLNEVALVSTSEDGMEDEFTLALKRELTRYGATLLTVFESLCAADKLALNTQAEALKLFGRIKHFGTRSRRLGLLTKFLGNQQAGIRDAAAVGLSYMAEPAALDSMVAAAAVESDPDVKEFMVTVARELGIARTNAASFAKGIA